MAASSIGVLPVVLTLVVFGGINSFTLWVSSFCLRVCKALASCTSRRPYCPTALSLCPSLCSSLDLALLSCGVDLDLAMPTTRACSLSTYSSVHCLEWDSRRSEYDVCEFTWFPNLSGTRYTDRLASG
jgi:hypothetical protein